MEYDTLSINVNHNYVHELQRKFDKLKFNRIEKNGGIYVTNPKNKSIENDQRIFRETQAKRILRSFLSPLVPKAVKKKLSYFSQEEHKNECKMYDIDEVQNLQPTETYAIHNIGHATLLIQIPGFNILTDPVFFDLHNQFYPAKTTSHPGIEELPKIDVIIISHNHRDHVDQNSLKELISCHQRKKCPLPNVFVPIGDRELLENFGFREVEEVDWYSKISVTNEAHKTVNFISIPSDHRSGRNGIYHHKSLVTGWVINSEQENVIFKFSGDTRPLSDENQQATDAVLWNEINNKKTEENEIPHIICLEPSGPNYTRCDMDITHQSTSYSALLKFKEIMNLANLSGRNPEEFLQKMKTLMIHHNKFELGPDRFNEGLFVFKKLIKYLNLNQADLDKELLKQEKKLERGSDRKKLKLISPFTSQPVISTLPKHTSLLVRAKDFIIREILDMKGKPESVDKELVKQYIVENTIFPKIGKRLNHEQIVSSKFDVNSVQKYNW